jgi:plastocyanin
MISTAAALLAIPVVASAAPREIDVGDDFFSPQRPPTRSVQAGQSFHWTSNGGTGSRHNVRQDDRLFDSGGLTRNLDFGIRASAGTFSYYCELHRVSGMTGVVRVRPAVIPTSTPGEALVQWASADTNTGSRFDVRYRVDNRKWKTWKNDTARTQGRFGRNDNPVNYTGRHTYKVKVRSERRNVSKRSGFSPPLSLIP